MLPPIEPDRPARPLHVNLSPVTNYS